MATVADAIANWLAEKEIAHGFGIVGGGNVSLWDAIARKGFTRLCSVHHEQAAAMSAAYVYRTSGRIALALVTTGAGSTNAITGVMAAWMDETPLLVISGNEAARFVNAPHERGFGVQGYDSSLVAAPFTKSSARLQKDDPYCRILEEHLAIALAPKQGPVWIDVPQDLQRERV